MNDYVDPDEPRADMAAVEALEDEGIDTSVLDGLSPSLKTRIANEWCRSLGLDPDGGEADDMDDEAELTRDQRDTMGGAGGMGGLHRNRESAGRHFSERDREPHRQFQKNRAGLAQFGITKFSEFQRAQRQAERTERHREPRRERPQARRPVSAARKFSEHRPSDLEEMYAANRSGLRAMGIANFSEFCRDYALGSTR